MNSFSVAANSLRGSIPDAMHYWSYMLSYSCIGNQLSGSIPESIKGMARITEIMIGRNQLSGHCWEESPRDTPQSRHVGKSASKPLPFLPTYIKQACLMGAAGEENKLESR